jgi:hypothetical protein
MLIFTQGLTIFLLKHRSISLKLVITNKFCFFALLDNEPPNNHHQLVALDFQKTVNKTPGCMAAGVVFFIASDRYLG